MHLRNAPAKGMESLGYSVGYKYAHDYPGISYMIWNICRLK